MPTRQSRSTPRPTLVGDVVGALRAAGCVFAEDEARLLAEAADSPSDVRAMVGRRVAGEPLEYIVGWAEFHRLRLEVGPGVFVPRRRTEFLVDCALELAAPPLVAVDLCCGCGAVGAALAASVSGVDLFAADIDPVAVTYARRNLRPAGGRVYRGDLFAPLPTMLRGRADLVLVNAPYVPTAAIAMMPPEARDHEPKVALDGGDDGLDVVRRVVADAPDWLAPTGSVLIEIGRPQADLVTAMLARAGLRPTLASAADLGSTVITGQLGTMPS